MSYQVGPKEKLVWFFFYIYDKFFLERKKTESTVFLKKGTNLRWLYQINLNW